VRQSCLHRHKSGTCCANSHSLVAELAERQQEGLKLSRGSSRGGRFHEKDLKPIHVCLENVTVCNLWLQCFHCRFSVGERGSPKSSDVYHLPVRDSRRRLLRLEGEHSGSRG
jgi:hypothetical protein